MDTAESTPVLSIRDLSVEFHTPEGVVRAVDHVSYDVAPGEIVGVVGESGSGKSVTAMSVLGLVPQPPARIVGGEILLDGVDLLRMPRRDLRRLRGRDVAMVFQDPMTALNPVLTVGRQLTEAILIHHRGLSRETARKRAAELLDSVGVPDARARLGQFPHQFSGGMRQRVVIAMALANRPRLLIADEPTTALDVTVQAQVLELLRRAREEFQAATVLITHNLGVVAELADRVVVMYGGRAVEIADVRSAFHEPRHPYTAQLLESLPRLSDDVLELRPIAGNPPNLAAPPSGCRFHPRCRLTAGRTECRDAAPALVHQPNGNAAACHFADELTVERP
ncbi:MAG: ATP-binding cassette domain-containing protein [Streptosporangiales bacterium]|nr:ATP-binding cassette domain-containing protein [Streptosporangiales bacterium]